MREWLNTERILWKKIVKPCRICKYCPYGQLIEEFPLKKQRSIESCEVFGHDCPAFYHAELMAEDKPYTKKEVYDMVNEFKSKQKKEVI